MPADLITAPPGLAITDAKAFRSWVNNDPAGARQILGEWALTQSATEPALSAGPCRIQQRRTAGWRMPKGAIACGRPTRWGNPWVVGEPVELRATGLNNGSGAGYYRPGGVRAYDIALPEDRLTAELAVRLYRIDLEAALAYGAAGDPDGIELVQALGLLRGHDLACSCPLTRPDGTRAPCHVDVLLDLANRPSTEGRR